MGIISYRHITTIARNRPEEYLGRSAINMHKHLYRISRDLMTMEKMCVWGREETLSAASWTYISLTITSMTYVFTQGIWYDDFKNVFQSVTRTIQTESKPHKKEY